MKYHLVYVFWVSDSKSDLIFKKKKKMDSKWRAIFLKTLPTPLYTYMFFELLISNIKSSFFFFKHSRYRISTVIYMFSWSLTPNLNLNKKKQYGGCEIIEIFLIVLNELKQNYVCVLRSLILNQKLKCIETNRRIQNTDNFH